MKRHFTVHLRRGAPRDVWAFGFTEDSDVKRIYFHKKSDLSDRESYFAASEVIGVDEVMPISLEIPDVPPIDEFIKYIASLPSAPAS